MSDKRQKNQLELAFTDESRSEAPRASAEGTESLAVEHGTESLAIGEELIEDVCEQDNCKQASARVSHDTLMAKIAARVSDKRFLKLIRSFPQAGVMVSGLPAGVCSANMEGGLVSSVDEGTLQGGPLSRETPSVLRGLEQWLRRRLRSAIWKKWKRGPRRFAELRKRAIDFQLAAKTAGSAHGPWHLANSNALSFALPNVYFDSLRIPRLTTTPIA